jgi:cysteine desulfurase / selenocysteine lyase
MTALKTRDSSPLAPGSAGGSSGVHPPEPTTAESTTATRLDQLRAQFPILSTTVHGKPLIYLDNAATTQKPRAVIDCESRYYETLNANIHRGVYTLSQDATAAYEKARTKVRKFINAAADKEIIFTRGTTEAINLVAASWGRKNLHPGDEVLISAMEHHSNIVPWQLICEQTGASLKVIPIDDAGQLIMDELPKLLESRRVKIVAVTHVSNALGTLNPAKEIIRQAHAAGAIALIDGAQWVSHGPTDVRDLNADFYAFSGHKLYGPTGIGVLYGKAALLDAMPPYQGGGDMIASVTFEKTTYNDLPYKFEAGTPNIAGGIGLGAAIDFVQSVGWDFISAHEQSLLEYATERLQSIDGLTLVGTAAEKCSVLSFVLRDIHPHDVGTILDGEGIAVRTGHHCCQPVMDRFSVPATARASLAFYNTKEEISALVRGIEAVKAMFA